LHIDCLSLGTGYANFARENSLLEVLAQVGINDKVLDVDLRTGIEINLAGNAGEAPEVLVLQVGAVTPTHDLHGNEILALLQIFGDVELGGNF
jgi:hypothetical protein